ncbi:MAG: HAMP domain-containing histidine kinase [Clostridia bacterium]|nr:HAMP domain-containing histidine kinase [Clostridia bacterium]
MKHWYRSLPIKIICFILCIVSLATVAVTVVGAILLANMQFYNKPKSALAEEYVYGRIYQDAYNIVFNALNGNENVAFTSDQTNLRYQIFSPDGDVIASNTPVVLKYDSKAWEYFRYCEVRSSDDGTNYIDLWSDRDDIDGENVYIFCAYINDSMAVDDIYALISRFIDIAYSFRYTIFPIGISALVLAFVFFIWLMCVSARRPRSDELHPGALNHIPFDLLLAFIVAMFVFAILATDGFYYYSDVGTAICIIAASFIAANIALGLCMSISARIKQRTLLTNTVTWMCCKFLWRILKWALAFLRRLLKGFGKVFRGIGGLFANIPLIWRTSLIILVVSLIELIVVLLSWWEPDNLILWWIAEKIVLVPIVMYSALFLRKLQKGGEALAKGDLEYRIDTGMMFWDFKRHGENLNSISDGMAAAVEQRLQSERMKAELITNVSHDIKTPLTSIINYAGLIAEEECGSEKHREYAEVLVRKSEHLKRLLEDLVEISKASSGNLEIVLTPCDAGVLLTQAAGEFEQRCQAADLELITTQPETPVRIMADSRRIWRVFENLMNNACKYSLIGSRVYLSLERVGNNAVFTLRNTSRTALNISPDELMERFVRGDASRSTEGNGLGLSIARSLTELQGGSMDISIDGDLFKVILTFPII